MLVDAHAHIFPAKIAEKATKSIGTFYGYPMEHLGCSQQLLESGRQVGVDRYLVCSTATSPKQVESINTFIAEECKSHPEFYGFATLHPDYEAIERETDRILELGLHGIKLHPDFQTFNIDDENALPMYTVCEKKRLPILFHMGDARYTYSAPHRLRNIADKFPNLLCVGAHFGGHKNWKEAMETLKDPPNVLFDTSSTLNFITPDEATDMIHYFGAERFMWGCDFPMWGHIGEMERFMRLNLTDAERNRIFSGTFLQYFH